MPTNPVPRSCALNLAELAARCRVAVVAVTHLRKLDRLAGVCCGGAVTVSADEALAGDRTDDGSGAAAEAADWLRAALADGPVSATEIKRRAAADGIAPRTLDRAKLRLGVKAAPSGYRGPWVWALPDYIAQQADGADGAHSAPTAPECANYPGLAHSGKSGALWAGSPDARRPDDRPPSYTVEPPAPQTNTLDARPPSVPG